jgi:hypothetical protein
VTEGTVTEGTVTEGTEGTVTEGTEGTEVHKRRNGVNGDVTEGRARRAPALGRRGWEVRTGQHKPAEADEAGLC